MRKKNFWTNFTFIALGISFVVSLVLILVINYDTQTRNFWDNQKNKLAIVTEKCLVEINAWVDSQMNIVKNIAGEVQDGNFEKEEDFEEFLLRVVERNPEIQLAYVTFDDGISYFSDKDVSTPDDAEFMRWYEFCKTQNGEIIFTEPYLDTISNGLVVSCLKAIKRNNMVGVVGSDILLSDLISKIDSLSPSKTGGTWLVSSEMKVITYFVDSTFLPKIIDSSTSSDIDLEETLPNDENTKKYIVQGDVAFLNAAWVLAQVNVVEILDDYIADKGILIEYIEDYDKVYKYEATASIASTGWILGVNIPLPDYAIEVNAVINGQIPIVLLAGLMSLISIVVAFLLINNVKRSKNFEKNMEVAQAASKTKSDFLSRMSHEIRTPMNAIIGMAKIADTTSDVTKLKYCLSTIEASSAHLLGIINDVLDMSKIEAGKLELDIAPMNLEKMLIKICNLIVDKTEQKKLRLDIILGKNMGMHYLNDELRLSQVIANLLSNAVKFTPEGGKIKFVIDEVAKEGQYSILRFSISDTGIGMSKEQISRLFQSFEQADGSISRRFGGTGLGLAISKNIVEKMNGKVWVESELGVGSTFTFEIKAERISQSQSGAVIFGGIRPCDLKILIVDDDGEVREQFLSLTDNFGIAADEADCGQKAIYLADIAKETKRPYDVIFLDYDMPGMNGIETAQNLSALIDKNTVIIMTTFLTWNKIEKEAQNVGVTRFISKPMFPSAVLDTINEVIGRTAKNLDIKTAKTDQQIDFSQINLLLAEDVEINREIFVALLESTHINIDTAENGIVAYQKFVKNADKYDIIIMDIQMPEMDGYAATQKIRELDFPKAKTIPIIAMTANVFKSDIDKCIASGMNDHLSKPINEDEVIKKIIHHLNIKNEGH